MLTPQIGVELTAVERMGMQMYRGDVYAALAAEAIRAAMYRAVDDVCRDWPRMGEQPTPTMDALAAEIHMDTVLSAEPLDLSKALDAIGAWRRAWVGTVQRHKELSR